jgi:hypothetical protein
MPDIRSRIVVSRRRMTITFPDFAPHAVGLELRLSHRRVLCARGLGMGPCSVVKSSAYV